MFVRLLDRWQEHLSHRFGSTLRLGPSCLCFPWVLIKLVSLSNATISFLADFLRRYLQLTIQMFFSLARSAFIF